MSLPFLKNSRSSFQLGKAVPTLPERIAFSLLDQSNGVAISLSPFFIIGCRTSIRDYEIKVDLSPFNGKTLGVARFHAMVLVLNNRILIKDLHSHEGTFLNGMQLVPDQEYELHNEDWLTFGTLLMQVLFVGVMSDEKYQPHSPVLTSRW